MYEAKEVAEHKEWCDIELSANEQTRKEKTSAVELNMLRWTNWK